MTIKLRTIRNGIIILIFMLLSAGIGYRFGQTDVKVAIQNFRPEVKITDRNPKSRPPADFGLFWEVFDRVEKMYVDRTKLDPQKMVYGAISGMVASIGDPYTVFLPPVQNQESKESLSGSFEGIGAQLGIKDGRIVVVAPISGMPAEKVGIRSGDWILRVDGKDTSGWTLPETVAKIRGPKGTEVTLSIMHQNSSEPETVKVTRDTIFIKSIEWKTLTASDSAKTKVAYLRLSRFGDGLNEEWNTAIDGILAEVPKESLRGLILDLRNNPGGYLDGAVFVAGEFMKDGLVVRQVNYDGTSQDHNVNRRGRLLDFPLIVLLNQGSASASEIVGGAIQSTGRAKIVGSQSFGKGSVQESEDLSGGAGLHITISKWLLPSGEWINGKGLAPDYKIELDDKDPTKDTQLDEALRQMILLVKNK